MRRKKMVFLAACALCMIAVLSASLVPGILAAPDNPSAGLSIPWWTVDNGGGTSQGGPYVLSGTAGQPDAAKSTGGTYILQSGFWSGIFNYLTFIPLVRH
jgi:hypothetical protein